MDSFRGFEDEAALGHAADDEPSPEYPPDIGLDERRMHVRAYNYWVSLLHGRPYPSIGDVDPHTLEDFGGNSVLLDFSQDPHDPQIAFLGGDLRTECGLDQGLRRISEVPTRSLLSRLTDHFMQIIANRAPIGFEAEFLSHHGCNTMYRGILMPLSSNGDSIDFIYGVINWKELADRSTAHALVSEVDRAIAAPPLVADCPVWADGPHAELDGGEDRGLNLSLWPDQAPNPEPVLPNDASLADRLCVARECAEQASAGEQRSRAALYRALGQAYDFALAAESDPENYAELLADAGIKVQARAPMTPIAKLVFGADYDKTRLTEFAAALSWACREELEQGALARMLETFDGGLKGIVQAERRARRPLPRPDRVEEIRDRLRTAPAFAHIEIEMPETEDEFVLLVGRREQGRLAVVAPVADRKLTDQVIRKSAA